MLNPKTLGSIALLFVAFVPFENAAAQSDMPRVHVFGEDDSESMRECQLSHDIAVATVESVLRYNRIGLASRDDYQAQQAIAAYVNLNAIRDRYDTGRVGSFCSASIRFSLRSIAAVPNPATGAQHVANIVYCEKGSLLSWEAVGLQARVNETLRNFVNACLSEYEEYRLR